MAREKLTSNTRTSMALEKLTSNTRTLSRLRSHHERTHPADHASAHVNDFKLFSLPMTRTARQRSNWRHVGSGELWLWLLTGIVHLTIEIPSLSLLLLFHALLHLRLATASAGRAATSARPSAPTFLPPYARSNWRSSSVSPSTCMACRLMASASCGIPCICMLSVLFLLLEPEHGLGEDVGRGRVPNKPLSLQPLLSRMAWELSTSFGCTGCKWHDVRNSHLIAT